MSAQEAAASSVPVVSSDLVPFVTDYLLGSSVEELTFNEDGEDHTLLVGEGAVVAPADDVAAFAEALKLLLSDRDRRESMGARALQITIPYFTWDARTSEMLADLGVSATRGFK